MGNFGVIIRMVIAILGSFAVAFWLGMVIWTFRDVRSRSEDMFTAVMAFLMVAVFTVPGLLLYLVIRPKETLAQSYDRVLQEDYLIQDLENSTCPNCHFRVAEEFNYCPQCRAQLKVECPECSRAKSIRWEACPYCGK